MPGYDSANRNVLSQLEGRQRRCLRNFRWKTVIKMFYLYAACMSPLSLQCCLLLKFCYALFLWQKKQLLRN